MALSVIQHTRFTLAYFKETYIILLENILAVRQATIDKLLDILYARVDRYENINNIICQQGDGRNACDA